MNNYIPGANKNVKAHRARNRLASQFKFWYEIKSGSQMATEFMNIEEAEAWLHSAQQIIVGIQIIERISKAEALNYLKRME